MLRLTQLSGFAAGSAEGCRATASLVATKTDTGSSSLYSFASVDLGAANPSRAIVIITVLKETEAGAALTVGGSPMTLLVEEQRDSGGEDLYISAHTIAYPVGTTADITVDPGSPSGATGCYLAVFRVISNVDELPFDLASFNAASGTSGALTLETRDGGLVIFGAAVRDELSIAWDVGTELYEAAGDVGASGGILTPTDGLEVTITASWSGSGINMGVALAYGCARVLSIDLGFVLARKNASQASIGTTPVQYTQDTDVDDATAVHAGGTITIPAAWAGGYGLFIAQAQLSDAGSTRSIYLIQELNGVATEGLGGLSSSTSGQNFLNVVSAPMPLVLDDEYTLEMATGSSTVSSAASTAFNWFSMYTLPNGFQGALLKKSAGQSIGTTAVAMVFGAEVYDTDGFHSNSSNTSRITVPTGVTLMQFAGCARCPVSGSQVYIQLYKNGAAVDGGFATDSDSGSLSTRVSAISAPIECVATDYFEMFVLCQTTQTFVADPNNWFAGWVLDPATEYALVQRTTTDQNINVAADISWEALTAGTSGFWTVGDPTKLTAPDTAKYLVIANIPSLTSGAGAQLVSFLQLNGAATAYGLAERDIETTGDDFGNLCSAVLSLTAGDDITLSCVHTSGEFGAEERGWLCMIKLAGL